VTSADVLTSTLTTLFQAHGYLACEWIMRDYVYKEKIVYTENTNHVERKDCL
jgi:hypothetical protein